MTNKDAHLQSLELNPNMQYIIAGDISGSMAEKDSRCDGKVKYDYMLEKFESFIRESADFDPDGATVILFSDDVKVYPNTTIDAVQSKLRSVKPSGYTNTDTMIQEAYSIHRQEKAELARQGKTHPGTVLFIFTDGAPTNRRAVEREIVKIANTIDRHDEFNIGFLTVGTVPADLAEWLENLDTNLKDAKYDIVNVSPLESVTFLKAVAKAVNE